MLARRAGVIVGCVAAYHRCSRRRMHAGKDAGRLAAAWALYQAQETLSSLAKQHGAPPSHLTSALQCGFSGPLLH